MDHSFQLDVALEEVETQRNGLVFIYNMTSSKYSNFDYDLSQKMLTLLKGKLCSRVTQILLLHVIILLILIIRLLPRPVKEGADSDGAALVQGALQGAQTLRAGEAEGQSVHCEHTPGTDQ